MGAGGWGQGGSSQLLLGLLDQKKQVNSPSTGVETMATGAGSAEEDCGALLKASGSPRLRVDPDP